MRETLRGYLVHPYFQEEEFVKRAIGVALLALLLASSILLAFEFQPFSAIAATQSDSTDWWSTFHHDLAHTGYSTSAAPLTNNTLWNFATGEVEGSPAVVNDDVYVVSTKETYALDATTGAEIWSASINSSLSSPTVDGGLVFVGSSDRNVYALNATTGKKVWNYTTASGGEGNLKVVGSPAVASGIVYVGANDNRLYALNETNGHQLWNFSSSSAIGDPAVANGIVYAPSDSPSDTLYALDAASGKLIWNYTAGGYVDSPAIVNGVVFVGSGDDNVYALNATSGERLWDYATSGWISSTPAVADGTVYIGSFDQYVYALTANYGTLEWKFMAEVDVSGSPAVADGVVFVGSGNYLNALSTVNGNFVWLYYGSNFDLEDSSPAIANGIVYIGGYMSGFYAFGAPSTSPGTPFFTYLVLIIVVVAVAVIAYWIIFVRRRANGNRK